jgi:hypothetical protein
VNFDNMGFAGVIGVIASIALVVTAVIIVAHGVVQLIRGKIKWSAWDMELNRSFSMKEHLGSAAIAASLGLVLLGVNSSGNGYYHRDQDINAEKKLFEEETRQRVIDDLAAQGLTVVNLDFDADLDMESRARVELQGQYEGCTYMYDYALNPRGEYVIVQGTGRPFTVRPQMYFTEDGQAHQPTCTPNLFPE